MALLSPKELAEDRKNMAGIAIVAAEQELIGAMLIAKPNVDGTLRILASSVLGVASKMLDDAALEMVRNALVASAEEAGWTLTFEGTASTPMVFVLTPKE